MSVPVTALSETRRGVPVPAIEAAGKCLDKDWKSRCLANPSFYGIKDTSAIASAKLEAPFVEYVLRGEKLGEYAASRSDDPRPYASITKYVFPILNGSDYVGGLVVLANETDDKSLVDSTLAHSAYVCTSFYPAVGPGGKMEEYRTRFPMAAGYSVDFVRIVGGPSAVMVTDRVGKSFILEGEALVPISQTSFWR